MQEDEHNPPALDQGTMVLRLVQLCPAPQPWHRPQGRALPFPPKFLLQFSRLQTQTAGNPWPYTAPGWALCCQLWFWGSLHGPSLQPPRRGSCPSQQGSSGWTQLQGSSQGPWTAGQWGQGWPKAKGEVAGAIAALGISPVAISRTVAISGTVLPTQAPGPERRDT